MSHGLLLMELIHNHLNLLYNQIWSDMSALSTKDLQKSMPANDLKEFKIFYFEY